MQRLLLSSLKEWKTKRDRLPLILYGARQVGKTHLINEFGKTCYQNTVYINFEQNRRMASFFDDDISPQRLLPLIAATVNQKIEPGATLLFFDEIQSCERALTSLKYFCEEAPAIHVIAAGSLLGIAVNRESYSFPVGKVESRTLYPMTFEEFLLALGREPLCGEIRSRCDSHQPMPGGLHQELMELYRFYLVTGGMPRAVDHFIRNRDLTEVRMIQHEIMNNYIADMAKYATAENSVKIRACYYSIPAQLAKENKKFQYKVVKAGGSAALFGMAIEWLNFAGVVLKCQKIGHAEIPLAVHAEIGSFKLYMGDTGMLTMNAGMESGLILSPLEMGNRFMGAVAENYTATALAASGHPLYYWQSGNTAEIDFILQKEGAVIPIEVKAGANIKSRSLSVFVEKYKSPWAIRISAKNFGFENGIKSVPLYAAFCI
ncbi:MAG: ATP-binding protein [Treponema sp.]|jgi:predicted AAA+ superfamily ATPase|nr:ATP-binding protein [Treponema sp.]